jgi:hypothetical protein
MEKQSVYIETTVVSYLTARPSRDLVVAAHQQVTAEWWEKMLVSERLFKASTLPGGLARH